MLPVTGKTEQQQFTIPSGVLKRTSTRQRGATIAQMNGL